DTDGVPNTDVHVFATFSYDGGRTFLPSKPVSGSESNAGLAGDTLGAVSLAMAANTFYVAWADNSLDPNLANPDWPTFDLASARVNVPVNLVTYEHVDAPAMNYNGGTWTLDVHDKDTPTRWAPDQGILYVHPSARTTQPAGFDFIGAGTGNPIWLLPVNQVPGILYLGTNAENTPLGVLSYYLEPDPRVGIEGEWIKLSLRDVRGP